MQAHRLFVLVLAGALVCGVSTTQAVQISDFQGGSTTGWNLTIPDGLGSTAPSLVATSSVAGMPAVAPDGGSQVLYVPAGGEATYTLPNQGAGDLIMYAYDPGTATTLGTDYGPRWGITSTDGLAPMMVAASKNGGFGGGNYSAYYFSGSGANLPGGTTDPTALWSRNLSLGFSRSNVAQQWAEYDFHVDTADQIMSITITYGSGPSIYSAITTGYPGNEANIPNQSIYNSSGDINEEWESTANGGTGPTGIGNVEIYGGQATSQFGGTYIDDVVWEPAVVPEPASLALLGLGAAGLFLRRRHA